jgi:hypothetical protein
VPYHTPPLQNLPEQKLGVPEATLEAPFIHSLLSNQRLYHKDYFTLPQYY